MISHTNNIGFSFLSHKGSPRLQLLTIDNEVIDKFIKCIDHLDVQSIEYKPFLRFYIANCLNELTKNTLGLCLLDILKNRQTGAVLLQYENDKSLVGEQFIDFNILLSTAVSHLIGLPNLDSMSGKFYARFSVKNEDNSDSYLRQAHRRMELHNDGTYVKEKTDWVIMQKILELNVEGGGSLLLHLDDWDELEKFHSHPVAKEDIQWGSPSSKNISYKTTHPIFIEEEGEEPIMSFIDQFAEPANMNQGLYLYELGESLEKDSNTYNIKLSEGSMLIINNYFWLHGRDMFFANKDLHRELLRQRGVFIQ
ncbi:glutarate dioxygenase GlaH [Candidatus Pseudothioglobus singularis]|jgi:protein CsiD|nr:glutarate dioxygenase GlaH [Candidatus Pseudothioglobus singularis]MDG1167091.1 glutarate dioxygenase GlaH [Candidatus Thioglobus sp.]MDC0469939.1 glutarate dioxygenase GlaH [Candidatus Pseudothioglobus singularis]MDC0596292.1 glutarate dioxygenase GlaH [Candidatus Pseudothioglobus singularis]MDC3280509.1 glutarate dioxygenase GlaH [Candidatus Pseudothioglobus singularis]